MGWEWRSRTAEARTSSAGDIWREPSKNAWIYWHFRGAALAPCLPLLISRTGTASEGNMVRKLMTLVAGFALMATAAAADTGEGRKDLQVFNDISKAVTRYAQFTIFDSVD